MINNAVMRKKEPIYEEMRSLAPYFLIISGVYLCVVIVLFFSMGCDYTLIIGAVYGIFVSVLNFFLLGKTAQAAVRKATPKSAQTYMSGMYCVRYLGLFLLLTLGALAPFINLVTSVIPLFFVRISIVIRTIKSKEE